MKFTYLKFILIITGFCCQLAYSMEAEQSKQPPLKKAGSLLILARSKGNASNLERAQSLEKLNLVDGLGQVSPQDKKEARSPVQRFKRENTPLMSFHQLSSSPEQSRHSPVKSLTKQDTSSQAVVDSDESSSVESDE